jgi:FkbM family methyltransferase
MADNDAYRRQPKPAVTCARLWQVSPALYGVARSMYHYSFPKRAYRNLTSEKWREAEIEMNLLPALVDPAREAVDVGANVGHYSLTLATLARCVHVYEPHPRLAYVLRHSMPRNVRIHNTAISDKTGSAVLTVPFFDRPVEGLASLSKQTFVHARRLARITVRCSTLDDLATQDIGFVKVDVEGHESKVLAGANHLIDRQRPTFLIEVEERHNAGAVQATLDYFSSKSYQGFFVWKSTVLPLEEFTMDMQDPSLIRPGSARIACDYVNNFIYVAQERGVNMPQLVELLRRARNDRR